MRPDTRNAELDRRNPDHAPRAIAVAADTRRRVILLGAGLLVLLALLAFAARAQAEEDARTLDDIEIEGEVRLPQVLFITSRDASRPLDWLEAWQGPAAADIASGAWTAPRIHLLSPVPGMPAAAGEGETGAPPSPGTEPIDSNESPSVSEEDLQ